MDYKTALISAARYLESQYEIKIDVDDARSIVKFRSYAKSMDDEFMTYYWEEYKKSYRNRSQECGESLYKTIKSGDKEQAEISSSRDWMNTVNENKQSKRFIRMPSIT